MSAINKVIKNWCTANRLNNMNIEMVITMTNVGTFGVIANAVKMQTHGNIPTKHPSKNTDKEFFVKSPTIPQKIIVMLHPMINNKEYRFVIPYIKLIDTIIIVDVIEYSIHLSVLMGRQRDTKA